MYRRKDYNQLEIEMPFNVSLNDQSKWVQLAELMPWADIEVLYQHHFKGNEGQVAKSSRLAFAALYIQTSEGFTDAKTVEHIQENPHLQYFCGFPNYRPEPPFHPSLMVHFRKRISAEMVQEISEKFFCSALSEDEEATEAQEQAMDCQEVESLSDCDEKVLETSEKTKGTLLLDATCCPQDIHYPTDMSLLNQVRETSEAVLDAVYKTVSDRVDHKPRNYREVAHREYMAYVKQRKHTKKSIRKALRLQLGYVKRNIQSIQNLLNQGAVLTEMDKKLYRKWLICAEVYRQQQVMFDTKTNRIDSRIVSIQQPWVRPIVRGKEGVPVEFGAKVAIGLVNGYAFITDMSFENFSEGKALPGAVERYRRIFGHYPAVVIGDKAYPTRENRRYCNERGIRLSCPKLGRKTAEEGKNERKQLYIDGCERNAVEGSFGVCKRKFGLSLIMAKLAETSRTAISMGFFVANMERKLRVFSAQNPNAVVFYDYDLSCLVLLSVLDKI